VAYLFAFGHDVLVKTFHDVVAGVNGRRSLALGQIRDAVTAKSADFVSVDHASFRAKVVVAVVVRRRQECFEITGEMDTECCFCWTRSLQSSGSGFCGACWRQFGMWASSTRWEKYVETDVAYETLFFVFGLIGDQAIEVFYVNVMGVESVRVIDQK